MPLWNYRVVNLRSLNEGRNWFAICEVFYNEQTKKPESFSTFYVGADGCKTIDDLRDVTQKMEKAFLLPVLEESDFPQGEVAEEYTPFNKGGFNDFTKFMEYVINNPLRPL